MLFRLMLRISCSAKRIELAIKWAFEGSCVFTILEQQERDVESAEHNSDAKYLEVVEILNLGNL